MLIFLKSVYLRDCVCRKSLEGYTEILYWVLLLGRVIRVRQISFIPSCVVLMLSWPVLLLG